MFGNISLTISSTVGNPVHGSSNISRLSVIALQILETHTVHLCYIQNLFCMDMEWLGEEGVDIKIWKEDAEGCSL